MHALRDIDYLIVSHPKFLEQANRLATFHESQGLNVEVVSPQQIYNEFSSGSQDVSAIRDFAKMLYDQDHPLRYLLLFGDASYDPKNRLSNNSNYIVSYQSSNSTNEFILMLLMIILHYLMRKKVYPLMLQIFLF